MLIKPFVDEGLGNSSYLIASEESGLAAVIDPERDVDRYVRAAEGLGLRLSYALDTHLHADFVSGARELAAQIAGLRVAASADAQLGFEYLALREGDAIPLGELSISALSTPGHTPEHVSYVVDRSGQPSPAAIFTGGALIVGGAARTDLLGHDLTVPLARKLYHSLHDKLLAFPDAVDVYPTHGAGSFCSAPASANRTTTIGRERASNQLAQAQSEEEFVARALSGLPSYPLYFKEMRPLNQRGPQVLGGLPSVKALSPGDVHDWLEHGNAASGPTSPDAQLRSAASRRGGAVLDVRPAGAFAERHIPGSYGIALDAPLITWAGWLIPFGTPLVLVSEGPADLAEAVRQLIRIGYDDLRGYLQGGPAAWQAAGMRVDCIRTLPAAELRKRLAATDAPLVLDVRQDAEWLAGHIPGAVHIENGRLPYDRLPLPTDRPIVVHCQHRDRSTAGLSILARRGYTNLSLLDGGFAAWEEAGYETARGAS